MSALPTLALLGSLAASVSAHGYVSGIVAAGTYYDGYSPSFQYQQTPPTVAGWSDPENLSNGYVAPHDFSNPDIICHLSATPGQTSIKVSAGETVELQWTTWPESHHGPVLDYLAKCSGDCTGVDKTSLSFFKISEGGLIDGSSSPGKWASDDLIANNNTWAVTIPTSIAAGNYVLRHEIIALHSANNEDGAQNYPQCINLEIASDGTDEPEGTVGTALYKADDAGIFVNIYNGLSGGYEIPGPALYSGAASDGPTGGSASKTGSAISAPTATAVAPSAPYSNSSAHAQTTTRVSTSNYAQQTYAPSATSEADAAVTSVATPIEYKPSAAPTFFSDVATSASAASASTTAAAATPTVTGGYGSDEGSDSDSGSDDKPSTELPEGWTLKDLQLWVSYLLKQGWSASRVHQRDFKM